MASSRGTLNGPDTRDLAATMMAFEHINKCALSLRMGIDHTVPELTLAFQLEAWTTDEGITGVKLLGSARSLAGYKDRRTVEAVMLQLMYALDAQMAEEEFRNAGIKSE